MSNAGSDRIAERNRLIIINLDDEWPFVDLVHRLALDLYGSGESDTVVEFRTMGTARRTGEQAKLHLIWGTRWPRDYGEDTESMLADLVDDLVLVDMQRIERIAILLVLPDPLSNAGRVRLAHAIARRLEERFDGHDSLRTRVLRIAAFRAGEHGRRSRFSTAWWPAISELLDDPTSGGRQAFDGAVILRRPTVRNEKEDVQAQQFILLRGLGEIIQAAWREPPIPAPGADLTRASSAAEFLRNLRLEPVALELPGQYPGLSSEKIALLLTAYRKQAIARSAAAPAGAAEGDNAVDLVRSEIDAIVNGIRLYVENTYRAISPPPAPPSQWTELSDSTTLWSQGVETRFIESVKEDAAALRRWSQQCLTDIAHKKEALFDEVLRSRDKDLRKRIAAIPLPNAGLNGEAATMIDALKRSVLAERTRLLERASEDRLTYLFAVIPSETSTAPVPQVDAWFERLAVERLPEHAQYEAAHRTVLAVLQKLIPKRFWVTPLLVGSAALATIFTHELALATGNGGIGSLVGQGQPVLYLALLAAILLGFLSIGKEVRRRRANLREAVEELLEQRQAFADRVHAMLDSAVNYLVLTTQMIWLDLLCHELDRRGAENDVNAYTSTLTRIAPDQRRQDRIPMTLQEEREFFTRHANAVSRERVTRWLTLTLNRIDPLTDLGTKRLDIAFAGSLAAEPEQGGEAPAPAPLERGGDYVLESRLFLDAATVNYRTLVKPQRVPDREEIHA